MATVTGFCSTCRRTVYLGRGDPVTCPVCASPLEPMEDQALAPAPADEHIARNEAIARAVNEGRRQAVAGWDADEHMDFLCECADKSCTEHIRLTLDNYMEVRANPWRFILRVGHDVPELEAVMERRDDYIVVEKTGRPRSLVEELDPNS